MKRKILFVTAIRSEYDILAAVIQAVDQHPALEAAVVVTGAHLSPLYGYTVREVRKDGFRIAAEIESLLSSDSPAARVKSAAIELAGLVDVFAREQPAFVVAPMDREEAFTVAIAGAYMRIPVLHIAGGDTAEDGNVDNSVRHAVSKLSHLHCTTSERSAQRLVAMGEEPWRVHVVGDPGLDRLRLTPAISDDELWKSIGTTPPNGPFVALIQHSILTQWQEAGPLMAETLKAMRSLKIRTFVSYPNTDAGSQQIIEVLERYSAEDPSVFHCYRNLPRLVFVNLLRRAHALVGNSSAGIVEGPFLKLPVVNIGPRQRGREHAENVQFVDHDAAQITAAVQRAVFDKQYREQVASCHNPYGDGYSGERIAEIVARLPIDDRLLNKRSTQ